MPGFFLAIALREPRNTHMIANRADGQTAEAIGNAHDHPYVARGLGWESYDLGLDDQDVRYPGSNHQVVQDVTNAKANAFAQGHSIRTNRNQLLFQFFRWLVVVWKRLPWFFFHQMKPRVGSADWLDFCWFWKIFFFPSMNWSKNPARLPSVRRTSSDLKLRPASNSTERSQQRIAFEWKFLFSNRKQILFQSWFLPVWPTGEIWYAN